MEVAGRTQYLAKVQGMPAEIEKELKLIIKDFVWKGDKRPAVAMSMLHKRVEEGGINLLDVQARNEAIDLIWLKGYLNLSPARPKWAAIADLLLARAVAAESKDTDPEARVNAFLQTWKVSTRAAARLPEDLRRMIKTAKKYGVVADSPNPSREIKAAMPIWYHVGLLDGRSTANSGASKCLRDRHDVNGTCGRTAGGSLGADTAAGARRAVPCKP
ncbi:hypothetical protein C8Q76DRAFT_772165 [Earliella scabrosa]|nr:hypothetical protein C8Q76DRAFT_772165 [Earliella scabrosa]